ncbi:hypothetical protein CLOM_g11853 [Closterium sp. NIES-68]|nr:hypothetical protein CLOM_g11853 [Closterium sp. NIES-68]GJP67870.1 hypothetical protein CLOP_g24633 [Closterium sp. NIES-67]
MEVGAAVLSRDSSSTEYLSFAALRSFWETRGVLQQSRVDALVSSATQRGAAPPADDADAWNGSPEDEACEQGSSSSDVSSDFSIDVSIDISIDVSSDVSSTILTLFSSSSSNSSDSSCNGSSPSEACSSGSSDCSSNAVRPSRVSVTAVGGGDADSSSCESAIVRRAERRRAADSERVLPSRIPKPGSARAGGKVGGGGEEEAVDAARAAIVRQETTASSRGRQQESKGHVPCSSGSRTGPARTTKAADTRPPWRP